MQVDPLIFGGKNVVVGKERIIVGAKGFLIDLLAILAHRLYFSYSIYKSGDGLWGESLSNGSWNGMVGEIMRKVRDFRFLTVLCSNHTRTSLCIGRDISVYFIIIKNI